MNFMSHIQLFDHVGITVADLDTVTAFFVGLGLEVEGLCCVVRSQAMLRRDLGPVLIRWPL